MKERNTRGSGSSTYGQQLGLTIGIIKNNHDPAHHGRLQVYIPVLDSEDYKVADLPWAIYVSPFGGVTANLKVGREGLTVPGLSSYGQWNIPKNGGQVLIGFLDNNPQTRFWLGCIFMPEFNRTMPSYINGLETELDDSGAYPSTQVDMLADNLADAGLGKDDDHFKTRGGYERSISHPSNKNKSKPTDNGYAPNPLDPSKADSQTYVPFRTPGGHYMVASDVDEYCRVRIKSTAGNQIILDDTNERIYISTAKGRNWVELDETNGRIYVYSDSKINIRAKNDINMYSDENINIVANKRVNIESETRSVVIKAKHDITALSTDANVKISASRDICLVTFDGPKAPYIPVQEIAANPAWHENPAGKGWIYRWAEEGGSATSNIRLKSAGTVESLSEKATLITSRKNIDIKAATNINSQAGKTINLSSTDYIVQANSIISHMTSKFLWTNDGSPISLHAIGIDSDPDSINIPVYADQNAMGASKPSAAVDTVKVASNQVTDHMVRPDHESWTRDEDEAKCKTARGPTYKG